VAPAAIAAFMRMSRSLLCCRRYMQHAIEIKRRTNVRRIFLATENASVIAEAMHLYPEFEWRAASDLASFALERSALEYHMADFVRDHPEQAALVCAAPKPARKLSQRMRNRMAEAGTAWCIPQVTYEAVRSMYLLSFGSYFVGTCMSQFGRLALSLRNARGAVRLQNPSGERLGSGWGSIDTEDKKQLLAELWGGWPGGGGVGSNASYSNSGRQLGESRPFPSMLTPILGRFPCPCTFVFVPYKL
jgi:hypothetical protein